MPTTCGSSTSTSAAQREQRPRRPRPACRIRHGSRGLRNPPGPRTLVPMQVYLDDTPLNGCDTLAQALRTASDRAQQAGRVIVEAYLDGAAISEAVLERPPEEALGDELRLTSVEPRALVRVTLTDAADALDAARQDQMRCADLIQTGKVEESMAPLSGAIQTWQAVRDAV